jgi:hypothetical protein
VEKDRKTRHFYYIIRNKIIPHRGKKCIKDLKGFLYTKKKKKKTLFNENRIIFVIEKNNLHPLLVHV